MHTARSLTVYRSIPWGRGLVCPTPPVCRPPPHNLRKLRLRAVKRSTTRMHSSRMRTGRLLTVCRSLLPGGVCSGGVCSGGVSAPVGCVCSRGGVFSRGVCSGGGVAFQHALRQTPPPCEQNDKQVQKYYLGHNSVGAGNKRQHKRRFSLSRSLSLGVNTT